MELTSKTGSKTILIISSVVTLLIIAGLGVGGYFFYKSYESKPTEENPETTTQEADPETPTTDTNSRTLYAYADCKIYEVTPEGGTDTGINNENDIDCLAREFTTSAMGLITNRETSKFYVIDYSDKTTSELTVDERITDRDGYSFAEILPTGEWYTYLTGDGLYLGTQEDQLAKKLAEIPGRILGRGVAYWDNLYISVNPAGDKVIIMDTFSSDLDSTPDDFTRLKVYDNEGNLLHESQENFGTWTGDNTFAYMKTAENPDGKVEIVNYSLETKEETHVGYFTDFEHMDSFDGMILIDQIDWKDPITTRSSYQPVPGINSSQTTIVDLETGEVVKTFTDKITQNYFLDRETIVGVEFQECLGTSMGPTEYTGPFKCPMEGGTDFYHEVNAILRHVDSDEKEKLFEYEPIGYLN